MGRADLSRRPGWGMLPPRLSGVAPRMPSVAISRRLLLAALPLSGLAACAELRSPRPRATLPLELVPPGEDPVRGAARLASAAFRDQGAGLSGRPVETARAAARLEFLAQILARDPRYAALPPGLILALRGAVGEVRQALGMADTLLPEQAVDGLAAIARWLEARGTAADSLFPPGLFPAGPQRSLQRLTEPGPLPEAAIATGRLEEAIAQLDTAAGWSGGMAPGEPNGQRGGLPPGGTMR